MVKVVVVPNIEKFDCINENITELDLSHCPKLQILFCPNNQLTELDLSYCPNLHALYCSNNQLTELNILNNDKITKCDWKDNPIYSKETNTIEKLKEYNRNNCSEYVLK